jgi:peroxiredoxin
MDPDRDRECRGETIAMIASRGRRSPAARLAGLLFGLFAILGLAAPAAVRAELAIGQVVPDFRLASVDGKQVSLAEFRGRHVVVEWTNPGCPFVRKHYESKNMPSLQKRYGAQNVAWLLVSSTHRGHADRLPPERLDATLKGWGAVAAATLLDEDGRIGKAWGARTTPQMYIIDPQGRLVYSGAIDDRRSAPLNARPTPTRRDRYGQQDLSEGFRARDEGRARPAQPKREGRAHRHGRVHLQRLARVPLRHRGRRAHRDEWQHGEQERRHGHDR